MQNEFMSASLNVAPPPLRRFILRACQLLASIQVFGGFFIHSAVIFLAPHMLEILFFFPWLPKTVCSTRCTGKTEQEDKRRLRRLSVWPLRSCFAAILVFGLLTRCRSLSNDLDFTAEYQTFGSVAAFWSVCSFM